MRYSHLKKSVILNQRTTKTRGLFFNSWILIDTKISIKILESDDSTSPLSRTSSIPPEAVINWLCKAKNCSTVKRFILLNP